MFFPNLNYRQNRWRICITWFLTGLLTALLISCGTSTSSNSNEVEFWTMQLQPKFNSYFQSLNEDFETSNAESKVRWVDVPWNAMESKILTAVSAKTAPDVVNLNPTFATQLATRNAWLNLNTEIPPEVQEQYLPKIWQANKLEVCQSETQCEETTFGIPWYLTTTITVYNQELFNQAGINQPPQTYQDLAIVAKEMKEKTGKYAFFVPLVTNDSSEVLQSFVQMGASLVDEAGKAAFNSPEGIEVYNYWVNLYKQGLLPPEVMTQGHRHAIELYQAGELALLGTGAEFLKTIANNAPTIYEQSAVSQQITGETGKRNVAVMNLVIPRDTDKANEAIKYALFVTNSENQLNFSTEANVLPSHTQAVAQYISNLEADDSQDLLTEARKISALQLDSAEVLIPPMKDINQLKKIIYESLQEAMLDEKTVSEAIAQAEQKWNENN